MNQDLIHRYSKPVPRYTSYPTAPHFNDTVDANTYEAWLAELPPGTPLSLYLHIPFCDRLCWFCGCHTKQVLRYDPIAAYLPALGKEIETVGGLIAGRGSLAAIHFGGGSPSMLKPDDLLMLTARMRGAFPMRDGFEFSIEIDPNDMTPDRFDAFAAAGVTRVSIGVQDFDPRVQAAINRYQSVEQTRVVVDGMRERGVTSTNLDVLYGLPFQTLDTLRGTIDHVIDMRPDRVALFGYAHVPWMKTHQKMIDESALPGVIERFEQSQDAAELLMAAGYERIGIDHFALPEDTLAVAARAGRLHRNFQGYTTDTAPALIGFGASSIGSLPQGHVQNVTPTGEYIRRIAESGLAITKGVAFSGEDRLRAHIIEQLMCNFRVDVAELGASFGDAEVDSALADMRTHCASDTDDLVSFDGRSFRVTDRGRPFVRSIAAKFDTYLAAGAARHSVAV